MATSARLPHGAPECHHGGHEHDFAVGGRSRDADSPGGVTIRILFADSCHPRAVAKLRARGFECIEKPQVEAAELGALLAAVDIDVLVVRSTTVTAEAVAASATLSLIVRAGAGFNNIDVAAASARGIYVCNTPGRNAVAVAELTMGLMIALDRHIADAAADLRHGNWDKPRYSRARGLRAALWASSGWVGSAWRLPTGRPASGCVSTRCAAPAGISRHTSGIEEWNITLHDSIADMAAICDVLSLHVSGTEQVVDAAVLAAMPSGAVLLNTARAGLVDSEALIAAMDTKGIRAGLDVFDDEPGGRRRRSPHVWSAPQRDRDTSYRCFHRAGAGGGGLRHRQGCEGLRGGANRQLREPRGPDAWAVT